MLPCCKLVPTGSSFFMGLIVLVSGHSKRSHSVFTKATNNLNVKKAELTHPWLVPVWIWPSEESKLLPWEGSFQKWNKIKLFKQHKGTRGTKLRWDLNQIKFHSWLTWPFGDACQGNTTIWVWLKSIISVWCFGRLGLQRRYRGFGPPSRKWYLRCKYYN